MTEGELLEQIYGTISDPARWADVLVQMADYLDAQGGLLNHISSGGKVLVVLGRVSEEAVKLYQQHYVWNPWSLSMRDVQPGKAMIASGLIQPRELHRSGFYADVLAPFGFRDALLTRHAALQRDGIGGFSFVLSARAADRAGQSLPRLQRLVPHLDRALGAAMEMGRLAGGAHKLAAVLNIMPSAALLLDRSGRIVHANSAAEQLLSTADGLSFDRDGRLQLAAALPAESAALLQALACALDVAAGAGLQLTEPVRITRPSGASPLLVIPVPLPPPAFALWELSDTARVLVLIIDPSAQAGNAAAFLRKSFGLTATEARVALLVGQGLSGPQAAIALGISAATVKTHLARCFDKMGVHSQVMLARLINALPVDLLTAGGTS